MGRGAAGVRECCGSAGARVGRGVAGVRECCGNAGARVGRGAAGVREYRDGVSNARKGLLAGIAAYSVWGLFALYWRWLGAIGAFELIAHRIVWSFVTIGIIVLVIRRHREVIAALRVPKVALILTAASLAIGINWTIFVWGVNAGHTVEVSLGTFTTPLVSVALGVIFFKERLGVLQWTALGLAAAALIYLAIDFGRPPWLALGIGVTFSAYSLLKKITPTAPLPGLLIETIVLLPVALLVIAIIGVRGETQFGHHGLANTLLVLTVGLVTVLPLLLFAVSAQIVPLSTVGVLQYITPTLQLITGIFIFGEPMPTARLIGFCLVWLALILYTFDALRTVSRGRRTRVMAEANVTDEIKAGVTEPI